MPSVLTNLVNTTVAAADVLAVNAAITVVTSKVPGNGTLTLVDDQRNSLTTINVANRVFVEDVLAEMVNNGPSILPPIFNATNLQNDITLYKQADNIVSQLDNASQQWSDTRRIAGNEAYNYALAVYRLYQAAAANGIPGAQESYDKLKARFEQQSTSTPATNP